MNSYEIEYIRISPVYKTIMVFLDYFCVHCFEILNSFRLTVLRPLTFVDKECSVQFCRFSIPALAKKILSSLHASLEFRLTHFNLDFQVEYYFSNEYLTRDAYFLRQIRRKREGYLSMKLITNFKKVRKLVKDPRITSYCLRHSQHLQVGKISTRFWIVNELEIG